MDVHRQERSNYKRQRVVHFYRDIWIIFVKVPIIKGNYAC